MLRNSTRFLLHAPTSNVVTSTTLVPCTSLHLPSERLLPSGNVWSVGTVKTSSFRGNTYVVGLVVITRMWHGQHTRIVLKRHGPLSTKKDKEI